MHRLALAGLLDIVQGTYMMLFGRELHPVQLATHLLTDVSQRLTLCRHTNITQRSDVFLCEANLQKWNK